MRSSRTGLALGLFLALGTTAFAGEAAHPAPTPAPPAPVVKDAAQLPSAASAQNQVPDIHVTQTTLPNGLVVLMSQDDRLPVVAVEVRYLVGSAHERKGRSGFAHLFEHLMFQGSEHYDKEYFTPFEPVGGSVNGTTSNDRTNYYERVPSEYLELAFWMESDRMQNLLPALTQAKLDNQRDVVKNERRQSYENRPYGMFWHYLSENMYPVGHPYHHTTIGSHADLSAATLGDVKAFFREYYAPANAVLTVVGDFDPERALGLAKDYFGGIAAGKRAPTPKAKAPSITQIKHVVHEDSVQFPRIYMAWPSPALYAPGDASMDVFASVLTDGKTSRLYKPLVYDTHVAQGVSAYQISRQMGGAFVVQATASPGVSVEKLAEHLSKAVEAALKTPPSADELERSVNGWQKTYYQRLQGVIDRATTFSNYYHLTGNPNYLSKDVARYTSLTSDQVFKDVTQYVSPEGYVRIDIVPKGTKKPGTKKAQSKSPTAVEVAQGGQP